MQLQKRVSVPESASSSSPACRVLSVQTPRLSTKFPSVAPKDHIWAPGGPWTQPAKRAATQPNAPGGGKAASAVCPPLSPGSGLCGNTQSKQIFLGIFEYRDRQCRETQLPRQRDWPTQVAANLPNDGLCRRSGQLKHEWVRLVDRSTPSDLEDPSFSDRAVPQTVSLKHMLGTLGAEGTSKYRRGWPFSSAPPAPRAGARVITHIPSCGSSLLRNS